MKFVINRSKLLDAMQIIIGASERIHPMAILLNVMLKTEQNTLYMCCSNTELEISCAIPLVNTNNIDGEITIPAKNLLDICRSLPENSDIAFSQSKNDCIVQSGACRFVLATLPAEEFPRIKWQESEAQTTINIAAATLKKIIDSTAFAIAQDDARYYLNGLLLEIKNNTLWSVATDGHRLALDGDNTPVTNENLPPRILIPRKSVFELSKLLSRSQTVQLQMTERYLRVIGENYIFITKLIESKYPSYEKAIPNDCDKKIILQREAIKSAFQRVTLLANSNAFKTLQMQLSQNQLKIVSTNRQAPAEETLEIVYDGPNLNINFNATYLIEALEHLTTESVVFSLKDSISSLLIEEKTTEKKPDNKLQVIMPLKN
ncbi:MAG: DNA polymerase III subunit beta [Gammaproteobacteria bacterium]|nr:DNA polymerase III subunit beta [Gammaproteobacteria bacterium]